MKVGHAGPAAAGGILFAIVSGINPADGNARRLGRTEDIIFPGTAAIGIPEREQVAICRKISKVGPSLNRYRWVARDDSPRQVEIRSAGAV